MSTWMTQREHAMAARADALAEPNAEVLLNGWCVGRTEYDPKVGTVLVMTWHDPAGCEHCTGVPYAVNPDAPEEGHDIRHNSYCPVHPDAGIGRFTAAEVGQLTDIARDLGVSDRANGCTDDANGCTDDALAVLDRALRRTVGYRADRRDLRDNEIIGLRDACHVGYLEALTGRRFESQR